MRYPGHTYGPHDPAGLPITVTILEAGVKFPREVRVPTHPAILAQRAQINDLAGPLGYVERRPVARVPLCHTCGKPLDRCLSERPGPDDHPFDG